MPQEPDRLTEDHAPAYRRFRDTYCYLDDGHAAERVVERLFARGPDRVGASPDRRMAFSAPGATILFE